METYETQGNSGSLAGGEGGAEEIAHNAVMVKWDPRYKRKKNITHFPSNLDFYRQ